MINCNQIIEGNSMINCIQIIDLTLILCIDRYFVDSRRSREPRICPTIFPTQMGKYQCETLVNLNLENHVQFWSPVLKEEESNWDRCYECLEETWRSRKQLV